MGEGVHFPKLFPENLYSPSPLPAQTQRGEGADLLRAGCK